MPEGLTYDGRSKELLNRLAAQCSPLTMYKLKGR